MQSLKGGLEEGSGGGWKTKEGYPGGPREDDQTGRGGTRHEQNREELAGWRKRAHQLCISRDKDVPSV